MLFALHLHLYFMPGGVQHKGDASTCDITINVNENPYPVNILYETSMALRTLTTWLCGDFC